MAYHISALILSVGMAAAAGLIGCFAVMRRMTLASDAISHVALPGIGLALLFRVHPFLGGAAALVLGTLLIWTVEYKTRMSTETIVGVVFSTALAIGSLLTPGEDLVEALFGNLRSLSVWEAGVGLLGATLVVLFVLRSRHELVIALVSPDMARTEGIKVGQLNLRFLLMFALTVALGLRFLGVLLMGSLIIIPAATAKHLARGLTPMLAVSVAISIASTLGGAYAARVTGQASGPMIISIAAGLFFLSLMRRRAI
jgi:ABC-type Mn2+/Zn2+ transport system permease subunit